MKSVSKSVCKAEPGKVGKVERPWLKRAMALSFVVGISMGAYAEAGQLGSGTTMAGVAANSSASQGWVRQGGTLRAKLRVLTYNIYGKSGNDCDKRAEAIGRWIAKASHPFHFAGIQEHWSTADAGIGSCDSHYFTDALWSTGRYTGPNEHYRYRPSANWWRFELDGGTSGFSLYPFQTFKEWEWDNSGAVSHGYILSRIAIPNTGVTVDIYNMHLQATSDGLFNCHKDCRADELKELAGQIHKQSANTGNPVIVMGDFNIGGPPANKGNPGYDDIQHYLRNPHDVWMEAHPGLPGTTYSCDNRLAGIICDNNQRIDYIFVLDDPWFTKSDYTVSLTSTKSVRTLALKTKDGIPGSDHYGVEATLDIRDKVSPRR